MKKLNLNKIKVSDLNLNAMDDMSMENIQGGVAANRTDFDRESSAKRTQGCTDGVTSGCTDGCSIFGGTLWNCTNSYCTDDCTPVSLNR